MDQLNTGRIRVRDLNTLISPRTRAPEDEQTLPSRHPQPGNVNPQIGLTDDIVDGSFKGVKGVPGLEVSNAPRGRFSLAKLVSLQKPQPDPPPGRRLIPVLPKEDKHQMPVIMECHSLAQGEMEKNKPLVVEISEGGDSLLTSTTSIISNKFPAGTVITLRNSESGMVKMYKCMSSGLAASQINAPIVKPVKTQSSGTVDGKRSWRVKGDTPCIVDPGSKTRINLTNKAVYSRTQTSHTSLPHQKIEYANVENQQTNLLQQNVVVASVQDPTNRQHHTYSNPTNVTQQNNMYSNNHNQTINVPQKNIMLSNNQNSTLKIPQQNMVYSNIQNPTTYVPQQNIVLLNNQNSTPKTSQQNIIYSNIQNPTTSLPQQNIVFSNNQNSTPKTPQQNIMYSNIQNPTTSLPQQNIVFSNNQNSTSKTQQRNIMYSNIQHSPTSVPQQNIVYSNIATANAPQNVVYSSANIPGRNVVYTNVPSPTASELSQNIVVSNMHNPPIQQQTIVIQSPVIQQPYATVEFQSSFPNDSNNLFVDSHSSLLPAENENIVLYPDPTNRRTVLVRNNVVQGVDKIGQPNIANVSKQQWNILQQQAKEQGGELAMKVPFVQQPNKPSSVKPRSPPPSYPSITYSNSSGGQTKSSLVFSKPGECNFPRDSAASGKPSNNISSFIPSLPLLRHYSKTGSTELQNKSGDMDEKNGSYSLRSKNGQLENKSKVQPPADLVQNSATESRSRIAYRAPVNLGGTNKQLKVVSPCESVQSTPEKDKECSAQQNETVNIQELANISQTAAKRVYKAVYHAKSLEKQNKDLAMKCGVVLKDCRVVVERLNLRSLKAIKQNEVIESHENCKEESISGPSRSLQNNTTEIILKSKCHSCKVPYPLHSFWKNEESGVILCQLCITQSFVASIDPDDDEIRQELIQNLLFDASSDEESTKVNSFNSKKRILDRPNKNVKRKRIRRLDSDSDSS